MLQLYLCIISFPLWYVTAKVVVIELFLCYWLDGPGYDSRQGQEIFFSSPYPSGLTLGPPSLLFIQWVPGLKWPGREVDNSPQFSTEVENEWIYPSAPPICLYGADRDNYTFAFYALWEEKFFYCLEDLFSSWKAFRKLFRQCPAFTISM